jgi:hypothetical protein
MRKNFILILSLMLFCLFIAACSKIKENPPKADTGKKEEAIEIPIPVY